MSENFRPAHLAPVPGWNRVEGAPVERIGGIGLQTPSGLVAMVSQFRDSEDAPWTWHVSVSFMGLFPLPDEGAMATLSELLPKVVAWEEKRPPGSRNLAVRHFFARAEET